VCSDFGIRASGTKGASIHVRAITRALCALGNRVTLLSPHGGPGGGHPVDVLAPSQQKCLKSPADDLRRWLKTRDLPLTAAGELRSIFYNESVVDEAIEVLRADPPDVIIERLSLFSHVGLDLARALDRPFIVEVNALLSREAARYRRLEMQTLAEAIEMRVLREADAVVVVSTALGDELVAAGVDCGKVHVVPNGADVRSFDPTNDGRSVRRMLGLDGNFVVGFLGSLKVWHGVDVLVSAFKQLVAQDAATKLLIIGQGPTESSLKQQIQDMGLGSSVVMTGAIDHSQVPSHLAAMDVAVAPFRASETFYFSPIKLFEYMAAARCVVASRLGQIEDVIEDGENGLLCQPDNCDALAEVLMSVRQNEGMRLRLGLAGRSHVENHFTWQVAATHLNSLLADLISCQEVRCRRSEVVSNCTSR